MSKIPVNPQFDIQIILNDNFPYALFEIKSALQKTSEIKKDAIYEDIQRLAIVKSLSPGGFKFQMQQILEFSRRLI